MPEAPELETIKKFLAERAVGKTVQSAIVHRPSVLRPMAGDFASDAIGRAIEDVQRTGKFLILALSGDRLIVVNPMLTGSFQWSAPTRRVFKRTCVTIGLSNGMELRYIDSRQMGRVYYTTPSQLDDVPQFADMGPDVLDCAPSLAEFEERLRPFRGEIKGIMTRGKALSGIGNAYADEILWDAMIYPFRKKSDLSRNDLRRLLESTKRVTSEAVARMGSAMQDDINAMRRDFLKVHNRGGEPCPRCGSAIVQLTANQRITSYCRTCQPGLLVRR